MLKSGKKLKRRYEKKMKKACKTLIMFFALTCGLFLYTGTAKAATTLVPTQMVNGSENVAARKYTLSVPVRGTSSVYPIQVSTPGELFIRINSSNIANTVKVALWKDANRNYPAASTWNSNFTAEPGEVKTDSMPVSTAGTYYLEVKYDWYGEAAGTINVSPYMVSSADRTMAANTWSAFAPEYNSRKTYARVNVTGNGYIGIAQQNSGAKNVTVALCNGSKNEIVSRSLSANKTYYYPVKKGTYYLRTEGTYDDITKIRYSLRGDFTATQGRMTTVSIMDSSTFDVRFKAEKTGLLNLRQYNSTSFFVTLLNSKKSPLSNSDFNWGRTTSFAVQKGKTYYFRINASNGNDDRTFSYSISGAKTAKNTSKKKATKLKKGKKKSFVIVPGDKKWHYFKFKLPKRKIPKIYVTSIGSGKYECQILKVKGTLTGTMDSNVRTTKYTTFLKMKKGTHYFRIRATKKSSAKITIKWK